jgi:hypothetical protein
VPLVARGTPASAGQVRHGRRHQQKGSQQLCRWLARLSRSLPACTCRVSCRGKRAFADGDTRSRRCCSSGCQRPLNGQTHQHDKYGSRGFSYKSFKSALEVLLRSRFPFKASAQFRASACPKRHILFVWRLNNMQVATQRHSFAGCSLPAARPASRCSISPLLHAVHHSACAM